MRILLTGAQGQLGRHLIPKLSDGYTLICADREKADLTEPRQVQALLDEARPDWIINTAAMTAVDAAETHPTLADQLNHQLPKQLAEWAKAQGASLVHYSTDYVFSGQGHQAWREDDPTDPQSVYGTSKLQGEQAVIATGASARILRTAWVYSALPGNFLTAILKRAKQGQALQVVDDQVGSPTWAGSLAEATHALLNNPPPSQQTTEILHVVNRGAISWHQFATQAVALAAKLGLIDEVVEVSPVSSDQWPQVAKRPSWSVLDPGKYETLVGHTLPSVDEALEACLTSWSQWSC